MVAKIHQLEERTPRASGGDPDFHTPIKIIY